MKAAINFMKDLRQFPIPVQIWLMILGMTNMMVPLFYWNHIEAKVMFATTILSFVLGVVLSKTNGVTRLLGIMHAPWIVGLYFIITSPSPIHLDNPFGLWMGSSLVFTSISLIIDFIDVIRYAAGDREPIVGKRLSAW